MAFFFHCLSRLFLCLTIFSFVVLVVFGGTWAITSFFELVSYLHDNHADIGVGTVALISLALFLFFNVMYSIVQRFWGTPR